MERFRLVCVPAGDSENDLSYLESLAGGPGPVFTANSSAALVLTWDAFISAAADVWRSLGPVDIFPDKVYVLPSGGVV